jgi:hypothetical protein
MDLDKLAEVAAAVHRQNELGFTIISKEYIQTGLNWIHAMHKIGLTNFLVIAGDIFTAEKLNERCIPHILAEIDESDFGSSFVSTTGFSAKGLAVSAFKFPVAHFLLVSGYNVVLSDADAIWMHDPMPYLRDTDLAFQRIVYHPPAIARLWGFAACGGFLSLRSGQQTISFIEDCLKGHQQLLSDQVAVNLALLEGQPDWQCEHTDWMLPVSGSQHDRASLEAAFDKFAKSPIRGKLRQGGLEVLALPHDKFWRHEFVTHSLQDTVIAHPNSPKDDVEKMKIFDAMGLRFQPD